MKFKSRNIFVLIFIFVILGFSQNVIYDNKLNSIILKNGKISVETANMDIYKTTILKYENSVSRNSFDLTISANFVMDYVFFYNRYGIEGDTLITLADTTMTISRPEGIYLILVGKFDTTFHHTLIAKDSIELIAPTEVQVLKQEADHTIRFSLFKRTGGSLYKSVISFYFYSRLSKPGLRISSFRAGADTFTLKTNNIPPYFDQEWAAKGKQLDNDGNIYLVSGELKTTQMDTTIINNPANYAYADFNYNYPDSLKSGHYFQLSTLFPDFHFAGSGGDPLYNHPFQVRIFQDTTVNISYHASTFIQFLSSNAIFYVSTQEVRITNNGVIGYFLSDREAPVYQIAESNQEVTLGLTPTYWFGKFYNKNDTIKIRSSHGRFEQLFLSQTNDALLHYDIDYQIFSNGLFIKSGKFPYAAGAPIMFLGFNPDSLTIPISPDSYKMVITDNQDEVTGLTGISRVTAQFDLTQPDKDPPNIILFQILSEGVLANVLDSAKTNKVRFILEDNQQVGSVNLYYSALNDTLWQEVTLSYNDPYWEAQIPSLIPGYYSLKLLTSDLQGNSIKCEMMPAFRMDEVSVIDRPVAKTIPDKFQLFQNYPNPFNPSTTIAYQLPERKRVKLAIYDITGRQVRTLVDEVQLAGNYQTTWNGTDQSGNVVSSGVYVYRLIVRAGSNQYESAKKMLLLR
jgi:hypothetical protein